MYKTTSTDQPALSIDKINVFNYRKSPGDMKFTLNMTLGPHHKPVEEYYKEFLNSHHLYFYVITETQSQAVSKGLSPGNRKNFTRMVELTGHQNIKKHQGGYTKVSLRDLFRSKKDSHKNSYGNTNTCSFELEVGYRNENFAQNRNRRHDLSIFCFIESSEESKTSSTKANIVYEKILKVNTRNQFFIPGTREAYLVDESRDNLIKGQPYRGTVTRGPLGNPRAKTAGKRSLGPKLKTVELQNNKIYSEQDLENAQEFQMNIPGMEMLSSAKAGESPERVSRSHLRLSHSTSQKTRNEIFQNAAFAGLREESTFITPETPDTAYYRAYSVPGQDILNTSYCGCVISLDMYKLLLSRSIFGPVIDFHRRAKNYAIIKEIISRSKIVDLKIYRIRASDNAEETTNLGTKKRGKYSKDEHEQLIIETSENFKKNINYQANSMAEIQEIILASVSGKETSTNIISLSLKDYDLFHNKDFGTYTYDIEVTIEDGAINYIQGLYKNIQNSSREFSNFAQATNSAINSSVPVPHDLKRTVSPAIRSYAAIATFFSGAKIRTLELEKQLASPSPKFSLIQGFSRTLKNTQATIEKYMQSYVPINQSADQSAEISQNKSSNALPGYIYAREKTNVFHNISQLLSICADPSSTDIESKEIPLYADFLANIKRANPVNEPDSQQRFQPNKFVQLEKSRYKIDDNTVYLIKGDGLPGLTSRSLAAHPGVKKENFSMGKIQSLETSAGYETLSEEKKRQFNIKIGSHINCGNESFMLRGKPDNFFEKFLTSNLSGVTISAAKFSSTSLPASAEQVLRDTIADMMPDATEELKRSIIDSAHKAKDRKEFENNLSNNYKELISIRKSLGTAYNSFSSYLSFNNIASNAENSLDYEKAYNDTRVERSESNTEIDTSPFDSESFKMYALVPGQGKVELSTAEDKALSGTGIIFVKLENNKQKKVPLINNGIFLRLK